MSTKQKTRKAVAKRFKLSATGKVRFKKAGLRHNTGLKARSYHRKRRAHGVLCDSDVVHIEPCLPYGSLK